jgi:hypothetical protein
MKSVLGLVAVIALATVACESEPQAPPPVAPAPPAPAVAPPVVTVEPPKPPEKKLITIATRSPDARAALLMAWDLADNGHNEEAIAQCKAAIAADPDFALGHTCVGSMTPGVAGQVELDAGLRLAAQLPDAERLYAEASAAYRRQEWTSTTPI